jgi:DNA polymerase I
MVPLCNDCRLPSVLGRRFRRSVYVRRAARMSTTCVAARRRTLYCPYANRASACGCLSGGSRPGVWTERSARVARRAASAQENRTTQAAGIADSRSDIARRYSSIGQSHPISTGGSEAGPAAALTGYASSCLMSTRKLLLVDGSSYLYRAFHALPPLTNSTGEPTGAVLGVINMLNKLMKEESPARVAVVFDAPGRTFRDDLFDQYKAHRAPMPDDLRSQVQPLLDAVEALGLPLLRVAGVEADDVIGTLAKQAADAGYDVLISTGDKDMCQLVGPRIGLVNTMSNTRLDREGVKAKFDVLPEQIVDYLALVGDSSDNIPGVTGVGPKTAAKWLNQYQNLDSLIRNAASINGKVGENLRSDLAALELSRRLATIDTAVPLAVNVEGLSAGEPDLSRLRELYTRLELRLLLRSLDSASGAMTPPALGPAAIVTPGVIEDSAGVGVETLPPAVATAPRRREYEKVLSQEAFDAWLAKLGAATLISFDTETDSLDYMRARIVGVSFAVSPGEAAYVPLAHDYPGAPQQLARDNVLAALKPLLEDAAKPKLGHHLKFDNHILANYGITLTGQRYDSMLESYVLNSVTTRHDMDSTVEKYLGIKTVHYEDVCGKGAKQITFNQVDVDRAAEYAAEDADVTLQLHQALWPQLEALPRLKNLYETIEQPLVPVLYRMERTGVLVDRELLKKQSTELAGRMLQLQAQAHVEAGGVFNVDSPKQLQEILFGKLGIPVIRKTPTGQPSTAEDVLEELAASYPLPKLILEYRGIAKLKSTYTDKLPEQIDQETGRIHTSYHQAVAATGRLSSSDPNLQNIPIRTPEGRRIRQAFVAAPGHSLVAADYSQIELRIMAHLSGDASLLGAFAEDRDVHQATAAEVFGTPLEAVSADQRRSAKAINFGLIYGMSAFGLARQLGIGRGEAQKYVDLYFDRYPGVKRYMDETKQKAREAGFVETIFGRRLYLPEILSRNQALRQYAERSAINAPMQGSAADIIKRAMIAVDGWLQTSSVPARLIMQVHDELVLEVADGAIETIVGPLREHMERAAELAVPLKVDVGIGRNWDEAH